MFRSGRSRRARAASGLVPLVAHEDTIVPTLSVFYGILIQMFWNDHAPPHFHALYAEDEALIDIGTLRVLEGHLPRRAQALVMEWAKAHRTG